MSYRSPVNGWSRRVAALVAAIAFGGLSCVSDSTGPRSASRVADRLAFAVQFPGPLQQVATGAGRVVSFTAVRVQLSREDGSIAFDRTVPFADTTQALRLDVNIPLSSTAPSEGELLALRLWYVNAANDTVFRGGPSQVVAVGRGEAPPQPVVVPLVYSGPGASAASVRLSPDTITVTAGQPFTFTATAADAQQAPVANAPMVFRSLDSARARITSPNAGAGTTLPTRGIARIRVDLASGAAADTSVLVILPRPASLAVVSGNAQTAVAATPLTDSLRVRLLATDGLALAGARVGLRVLTGGGTLSSDSLTTDANGVIAFRWVLGSTVGAQSMEVGSAGVTALTLTATATAPTSVGRSLLIAAQPPDGISAGDTLTPPIFVQVVDSANAVVSSAQDVITLSIASGPAGATLAGQTVVQAVTGIAPFVSWRVNGPVGVYRFVVTAPGLLPDTTTPIPVNPGRPSVLEIVSGDAQSAFTDETLPLPITVRVRDAFTNPVPGVSVTFAVTAGGGTVTGATQNTNATGVASPTSWRLGSTAGPQSLQASIVGATPVTISATALARPPAVVLGIQGTNVVGVGRVGTMLVRLLQPAPAGGLTVSLANQQPALLTIAPPSSVTIAAGDTLGSIEMSGVAEGTARVLATAPGFVPDTLDVPVTLNLISLPTTLSVPLNQTQSLPVQLSTPAPAGGVRVVVTSANPAVARPVVDTVTVAAGATLVNATMQGTGLGSTIVTASNANYASDSSAVTVTAGVDIVPVSLSLNASFGTTMTVRLASAGAPIPAPPGGTVLSLSAVTPSCVALPATATIDAGNSSVTVPVSYGGTGAPCSSLIRASGPAGFATDSITASVAATPPISTTASTALGAGLQRTFTYFLGASNHPGVTVRATSLDSTKLRVSASATTVGGGTADVVMTPGSTSDVIVLQATEGWLADTVPVILTAPGFVPDTIRVAIHLPLVELQGVVATRNTNSADDAFVAAIGTPATPTATVLSNSDAVRAGSAGVTVRIVNDTAAVGRFVQTAGLTDTASVTIAAQAVTSPTSVASGGVAFRPLAPGVASLRAIVSGARLGTNAVRTVTVTQPVFTALSGLQIGAGLQRAGSLTLGAATPDSLLVTLKFDRVGVALLSPDATTPGADSIIVPMAPGTTTRSFVVAGVDGVLQDSVQLIATAPGYLSRQVLTRVWQPVLQLTSAQADATTLDPEDPFIVAVGTPNAPTGTFISTTDARRAGATPYAVTVSSSNTAVARFNQTAGLSDTARLQIVAGQASSPSSVAAGGAAVRYVGAGTTTLRASVPGLRAIPASELALTVTQPAVQSLSSLAVGSGLQRNASVSLSNATPDSAVQVLLRPDRTGVILLSPNATTVGADSLILTIPAGGSSATFVVQALEGIVSDSVTLTASLPGYTSRTATQRVYQPILGVSGLSSTSNTFALDDPFVAFVATPLSPTSNSVSSGDVVRAGGTPIVVTMTSGTPSVGRLVTSSGAGATQSLTIPVGSNATPNSVALGGFAFQVLTTGTTIVTASAPGMRPIAPGFTNPATTTVTVSAPDITLTSSAVGSGLQRAATGVLSTSTHGGTSVVLRSTNPAVLRLARFATDIATDSIIVPVANNNASFSYLIVGMEGQVGSPSVEARAVGFTDGVAAMTVQEPAIQIGALSTTQVAGGADDPFTVTIGITNAVQSALTSAQAVRAGSPGVVVTVTSSAPTAGVLVRNGVTSATATVTIPAGLTATANTVADGILFRPLSATGSPTRVSATAPGVISTTAAGVNVTVNP